MDQSVLNLIYLASSIVNGRTIDVKRISNLDLDSLFQTACFHQMTSVIAFALDSAGIKDDRFTEEKYRTVAQHVVLDTERKEITTELEKAGIWYLPLKGMVIRNYYPNIAMRQMCDNDILYDADFSLKVNSIMETHGFRRVPPDGIEHQEVYTKPPFCVFEMHPMLFDTWTDENYLKYYNSIQTKLIGEGAEKHLSNEDFYIYMITHEHKHYFWKGTGLRPLLDVYVFLKCFDGELNWNYIDSEIEKIGIGDFEKRNRSIALKLFGNGNADDIDKNETAMLEYLIQSGAGGNNDNAIRNRMMIVGKLRYYKERIFLPMKGVKYHYPLFHKYKILLPFLPVYRLLHGWKNAHKEIETIRSFSKEKKHKDTR